MGNESSVFIYWQYVDADDNKESGHQTIRHRNYFDVVWREKKEKKNIPYPPSTVDSLNSD